MIRFNLRKPSPSKNVFLFHSVKEWLFDLSRLLSCRRRRQLRRRIKKKYNKCYAKKRFPIGENTLSCLNKQGIFQALRQAINLMWGNRHEYYVYIVTNHERTVLYVGVTNNLAIRLMEHYANRGAFKTFAGRYYCYNLIYYETFQYIKSAIAREKEIKGWRRQKKLDLIKTINPNWFFLNERFCIHWPPKDIQTRF